MFNWPTFTNASDSTQMGQNCQGIAKAHHIKNCAHWKNVQKQMERVKFWFQENFRLSHMDLPPHIIMGIDNGRMQ